ncbi:ribosomal protein L11 methyltransferase [Legionella londiniensis]|uniref:Ribosomal protein L11 methyltransferase n=1 Tax=Legionella londiniensis TaxID=45068 RepID=A0A0W0VSQ7_9GAMM|nr:ribosomal protein L11 methyltransferase [Legionella londiniensis]STX93826.1 ribosomal protein L11 methyltransferase [Legionella londiniensis]
MLQIEIECRREDVEPLSALLEESGALSQILTDKFDNAILEPELGTTPLWPDVIFQALFADPEDAKAAARQISERFPQLNPSISPLPEKDWERACLDEFKPLRFGKRLWVTPSWLTPPDTQAVNLILDPGLAFGTGTHATTSLCLEWLEQADVSQKTIIDYGCGSGIIALAGLKLGARHAYAVDIDEQALQATQYNAELNALGSEYLTTGFPEILQNSSDILIANILLSPLLTLKESFFQLVNQQGMLAVSGILKDQASILAEAYASHFQLLTTLQKDEWVLLIFKPKQTPVE